MEESERHAGHALHVPHRNTRQPLLDGRFDWVWGEMEKAGIPAMVLFHHEHMHLANSVAERYPGLRLVMDHLGLKSDKNVTEASNFASLDKVLALAKRPNVAAKTTALPCYSGDKTYPYRSLHPYIRRVYDAFGPKRMFWAPMVAPAVQLSPGRDHVHRGAAVALGRGQGMDHGPRRLRLARLEILASRVGGGRCHGYQSP